MYPDSITLRGVVETQASRVANGFPAGRISEEELGIALAAIIRISAKELGVAPEAVIREMRTLATMAGE